MCITKNILSDSTRLVVFDLDGTLYSKRHLVLRMPLRYPWDIPMMLKERKTRASLKGCWVGNSKSMNKLFFSKMTENNSISSLEAEEWFYNQYLPRMVKMLHRHYRVSDWVVPFINHCRSKGIKIVVLSDSQFTKEKLEAIGLSPDLFDWVISSPEIGGLKPAPQLLRTVVEKMSVDMSECLVIGDREDTDGEMARANGAAFYLVSYE